MDKMTQYYAALHNLVAEGLVTYDPETDTVALTPKGMVVKIDDNE